MSDPIIGAVRRLLVNDLCVERPADQIGLDDGLGSVVGVDSVGFDELRVLCQQKFNVYISDGDYTADNFGTVRKIAGLINRLHSAQKSGAG